MAEQKLEDLNSAQLQKKVLQKKADQFFHEMESGLLEYRRL